MAHIEFFADSYQYAHRVLLEKVPSGHGLQDWTVHPMKFRANCECTRARGRCPNEPGGGLDLHQYAGFLGLQREQILPRDQQAPAPVQGTLTEDVQNCPYLFLDPDTGIDVAGTITGRQKHIRGTDLVAIARQEGRQLVLVFEHSKKRETLTLGAVFDPEVEVLCDVCQERRNGHNQAVKLCSRCNTVLSLRRRLEELSQINRQGQEAVHCGAVIVRGGPLVSYVWLSTNKDTVEHVRLTLLNELPMPGWRLLVCPCGNCAPN